jgi:hypothetical protein
MRFGGGLLPACGLGLLIAGEAGTAVAAPAADTNNLSDNKFYFSRFNTIDLASVHGRLDKPVDIPRA